MKAAIVLLPLLSLSTCLASPTGEQIVLGLSEPSRRPVLSSADALHAVNEWLDDAKKAILKGKNNLEKWYHDGKEFIKQNELLCEKVFTLLRLARLILDRRTCLASVV
jgi:cathepsin A (carboxypeptidase C)